MVLKWRENRNCRGIWSVHKLKENLNDESIFILDVRKIGEYEKVGHVEGAYHIFVGYLKDRLNEIPRGCLTVNFF